jgi:hypothetical protein
MASEMDYHDKPVAESHADAGPSGQIESPFCASLRSKRFFMMDQLGTEASHYLDSSNHCWCRETQLVIGPDDGRVRPARCVPGRACYRSAL